MMRELMDLKDDKLSQKEFADKLISKKNEFRALLQTKIKSMLPNQKLPKVGIGLKSNN